MSLPAKSLPQACRLHPQHALSMTFVASSITHPPPNSYPQHTSYTPAPLALTVVATSQRAMALPTRSIP